MLHTMPPRRNQERSNTKQAGIQNHIPSAPRLSNPVHPLDPSLNVAGSSLAIILIYYLSGSSSLLLSRLLGNWPAAAVRWVLVAIAITAASFGWKSIPSSGFQETIHTRAFLWAFSSILALAMRRTLSAASLLFLSVASRSETMIDSELLVRWTLVGLLGCGWAFIPLGYTLGRELRTLSLNSLPKSLFLLGAGILQVGSHLWRTSPICLGPNITAIACIIFGNVIIIRQKGATSLYKSTRGIFPILFIAVCSIAVLTGWRCTLGCRPVLQEERGVQYVTNHRQSVHTLSRCELRHGGLLSVVQGTLPHPPMQYRAMRLDHSIMGGCWESPEEAKGKSIYAAFYLQAAARIFLPGQELSKTHEMHEMGGSVAPSRSLHVGLGAGTAVTALQRRGFIADVIEIHPEVIDAARNYFNVQPLGKVIAQDAVLAVPRLKAHSYDLAILDVFSGGEEAPGLSSEEFLHSLKRVLAPEGVLVVNFAGFQGLHFKSLLCRMQQIFPAVRCFAEVLSEENSGNKDIFRNYVVVGFLNGSASGVDVRAVAQREVEMILSSDNDDMEAQVLSEMADNEINIGWASRERCAAGNKGKGWFRREAERQLEAYHSAAAHWRIMRQQFGDDFWTL